MRFRAGAGDKAATALAGGGLGLEFGAVGGAEPVRVELRGRTFEGVFVIAGVPHFVVPMEQVADVPLREWAPGLRRHERFGAAGANVDFAARRADGRVDMRTYERGVEGETLACGSGAIAVARWAVGADAAAPVTVRTAGGDDLVVRFEQQEGRLAATLMGPAETVYTGQWPG